MKRTKYGQPMPFAASWNSIVDRMIAGCDQVVLADAMKQSLMPFSLFRDVVDIDLHVLMQDLSEDDLRRALDAYVYLFDTMIQAYDQVFAQAVPESSAAVIYRRPLEIIRDFLITLRDGSPSRWTDLIIKAQGDRTDPRHLREYKDQAFRTYKLLLSVGASAAGAVEAINAAAAAHTNSLGLPPFGGPTADTLRRRSSKVRCFNEAETKEVLSRSPIPISELRSLDQDERKLALRRISSIALSKVLDDGWSRTRR
jgi:hypothetical protein